MSSTASGGGAVNRIIDVEYTDKIFDDPVYIAETIKSITATQAGNSLNISATIRQWTKYATSKKEYTKILQQPNLRISNQLRHRLSLPPIISLHAAFLTTEELDR